MADEDFQEHADVAVGGGDCGGSAAGDRAGGEDWLGTASASVKRQRGRPKGAKNRKTADFAAWYEANGFKDPLEFMAEFMSANPVELQAFFAEHEKTYKAIGKNVGKAVPSLSEIVEEQLACADKLAPYLHGKAPAAILPPDERLPVLVLNLGTNQLDQARQIAGQRGLSVGMPLTIDASKNNDLAVDDRQSRTEVSRTKQESEE